MEYDFLYEKKENYYIQPQKELYISYYDNIETVDSFEKIEEPSKVIIIEIT